jgi:multidrug efflux pump subunit AcrB
MNATTNGSHARLQSGPGTGWIAYFVGNPVAANLLMVFFLVAGIVSGTRIAVEATPELDLRTVTVTVRSPGSSPREVEEDIIRRVEESVIGFQGVDRVVATATEGVATINIELTTFANADKVLDDVKQAVDALENFPPLNAERPEVELAPTNDLVLTLAVTSDVLNEDGLRRAAENVRRELLQLPGTSRVNMYGMRDREIAIELNEEALRRYDLELQEVANSVRRASLNLTFGELQTEAGDVVLHTIAKRTLGPEFAGIPLITRPDGAIVTLGDVADIRDAFVDGEVVAQVDGVPAMFVRVAHTRGQSLTRAAKEIRDWLVGYEAPRDVNIFVWDDRAEPNRDRLARLGQTSIVGVILVFLLLMLVFDLRAAVWITLGIPFSIVGSLIFFGPANLSMHLGTLTAMFLMIGLVVDDALVVGEGIAAARERGLEPLAAAVAGVRSVVSPITIAAATTVLAFVPFYFLTHPTLQVVKVYPLVAFFVLVVSLIEAIFILPAHLGHVRRWSLWPLSAVQGWVCEWIEMVRDRTVGPAVSWSVRNVWTTLVIGVAVVAVPVLLIRFEAVRFIVFSVQASDYVQADLELPVGTPFAVTRAATEEVVAAAQAVNEQLPGVPVRAVSFVAGQMIEWPWIGTAIPTDSHLAGVRVYLNERPLRRSMPWDVTRVWQQNLDSDAGLGQIQFWSSNLRESPTIAYVLMHEDEQVLQQVVAEMRSFMADVPGVIQITDSFVPGKRHLQIELTPAGEAAGLTPATVGSQLRANFHGVEVQRIQRGHEEVKVMVRYPPERRASLRELDRERIRLLGGVEMPLSAVAQVHESRELATRTRIDGSLAALVNAYADTTVTTPNQARRIIDQDFLPRLREQYPGLRIEPGAGARDEQAMFQTLALLLPIVLIAMYALMAGFLRSYWKPLVAVAGFPISFAGAVLGHWILGWDFQAMSLFGVIAVFGVVVNDALVLLDRYNTIRRENPMLPAIAAASAATRHRFRAIFLTSLTTVVGLSPLLYERGDDLLFIVPFIVSMMGGLILSGLFILFILPALVMVVEGSDE